MSIPRAATGARKSLFTPRRLSLFLGIVLGLPAGWDAHADPGASRTAIPDSVGTLRAALAQRRQGGSPPLAGVIRVARGAGADEEAEESPAVFHWRPGVPARFEAVPVEALPGVLRGLELPLLDPGTAVILAFRRQIPRGPPSRSQPPEPRQWLLPLSGPHRVVGVGALAFRKAPLPDEYDPEYASLALVLKLPGGHAEVALNPVTLHVERMDWRSGGERGTLLVEDVRPIGDAGDTGREAARLPAPAASAPFRLPGPIGAPRGVLRVLEQAAPAPHTLSYKVEGAGQLGEGDVVDIRLTIHREEVQRGERTVEAARCRCPSSGGRFEAEFVVPRHELGAGRVEATATREGDAAPLAAVSFLVPVEAWGLAFLAELRTAGRVLAALADERPPDARSLAAVAREKPWVFLPATRRAVETLLRDRASGSAPPSTGSDGVAVGREASIPASRGPERDKGLEPLRDLLAREARWAVVERLAAIGPRVPPAEVRAVQRLLSELPPAPDEVDRAFEALVDACAAAAPPAAGGTEGACRSSGDLETIREEVRRRLRAAPP